MRSINSWLDEYSDSHRNPFNEFVHWVCVPAIMLSLLGLLWSLWFPPLLRGLSPLFNWSLPAVVLATGFYYLLSVRLALGMVVVSAVMLGMLSWLDTLPIPLWQLSLAIFVIAWVGQFIGHLVEGRRPSFFRDVQFLLIGPVWLLARVYRRFGIPY